MVKQYVDSENSKNIIYEIPEEDHPDVDTAESGDEHVKNTKSVKITKENLNAREICKTDKRNKAIV
jgi:hypothetical protein